MQSLRFFGVLCALLLQVSPALQAQGVERKLAPDRAGITVPRIQGRRILRATTRNSPGAYFAVGVAGAQCA